VTFLPEKEGHKPFRPKLGIADFSDLIFGLALTIAAVTLTVNPPKTPFEIYVDIAIFSFNFYVLISVWVKHNQIMSLLPIERIQTRITNILLLLFVSIEPFLFNNLQTTITGTESSTFYSVASAIFGINIGLIMLMQALLCNEIATKDRTLVSQNLINPFKAERNVLVFCALIFFISAIPIFWSTQIDGFALRYFIWVIPAGLVWVDRLYILNLEKRLHYR
jgi:uncharacterized membrane protein